MNTITIIILTLIIYSFIATFVYVVFRENENILICFGFGIVGLSLLFILRCIKHIQKYIKHYNQRSIFKEVNTGKLYKCKLKDTNDVEWSSEYKIKKRYAKRYEWESIPDFDQAFIEKCKNNCDRCKFDAECRDDFPYDKVKCKHDQYGTVIEFDKFQKKRGKVR